LSKTTNIKSEPSTVPRVLLVFGNVTSGKTTLGKKLVAKGVYEVVLEADEFWKAVSGLDHAWRMKGEEKNPKVEIHRHLKNEVLARCVQGLAPHYTVVVTGLWPHESQPLLERLQQYKAVVLKFQAWGPEAVEPTFKGLKDVAANRFAERGQSIQEFKDSGAYQDFDRNEENFRLLAEKLESRGKLTFDKRIMDLVSEYPGHTVYGNSLSASKAEENGTGVQALGLGKPTMISRGEKFTMGKTRASEE